MRRKGPLRALASALQNADLWPKASSCGESRIKVEDIDHVHIEVRDRDAAAEWYRRVLGLVRHEGLAQWADDPMGPLVLATSDAKPVLSLFARKTKPISRDATIAFRVAGQPFLDFLTKLADQDLVHQSGRKLTSEDVVDHAVSWSLYFFDPDGNQLEVTTYDYERVKSVLFN